MIFRVMTLCTDVVGYQCFGGLCCLWWSEWGWEKGHGSRQGV